jgi:hypothetical protein
LVDAAQSGPNIKRWRALWREGARMWLQRQPTTRPKAGSTLNADATSIGKLSYDPSIPSVSEANMSHFRWLAIVKYRTNAGVNEVDHQFEELFELHDLIERGPDWNCVESIHIQLNSQRKAYNDTVEQTERRKFSRDELLALAAALEDNPSLVYPNRPQRS